MIVAWNSLWNPRGTREFRKLKKTGPTLTDTVSFFFISYGRYDDSAVDIFICNTYTFI